jgi:hypothetical protein
VGEQQGSIFSVVSAPTSQHTNRLYNVLRKIRFLWRFSVGRKWRATIFAITLLLIGALSLFYSSKALADLLFYPTPADALKTSIVLKPNPAVSSDATLMEADLLEARQVVAQRLDQLNLPGSYQLVNQSGQLTITLPESENTPYIINIVTHVGKIEFINGGLESPPLGRPVKTGLQAASSEQNVYPTLFIGQEVEEIVPPDSTTGQIFYRLTLNSVAAKRFTDFVEAQPGAYVCMVLDRQVINCSVMYHLTNNTLDILPNLGSSTMVSLADLAIFLESGPLPLPLRVER